MSSLPVPLSPEMSTATLLAATSSTVSRMEIILGELEMISGKAWSALTLWRR